MKAAKKIMKKPNIIQRRDLEPLWHMANEVVRHYEKAADCISAVMGADCIAVENSRHPTSGLFCSLCKRYSGYASKIPPHEIPCSAMHCSAAKNARRHGGSYIYTCPVGFSFWTSPFYSGELFAGAFIASAISSSGQQQTLDRLFEVCKGEISRAEIAGYIEKVPVKTDEEIRALARMIQLCAQQISRRKLPLVNPMEHSDMDTIEQERLLLASLRRGDNIEALETTRELLSGLNAASGGNFTKFRLMAIELVVKLSRTGSNFQNNQELIEANSRYLKRIEELNTAEEVIEYLCMVVERMSHKIFSFQGMHHSSALRKAERFIRENYARKISLQEIADASGLSAPYFSTVFKDEMGENLSSYLNRLRVENACSMLRETEVPISKIAVACGFEDQSWFSKTFKNYTGLSPCKYRKTGCFNENEL